MKSVSYTYKNMPIPGGGYVTGFLFSRKNPCRLYIRTDIGGTYRHDFKKNRWEPLISHVSIPDLSETYPTAIALDERRPDRLFIVCGRGGTENGTFAISEDCGNTFAYKPIPTPVHGNWNGRGTGYRLVCDVSRPDTLYFASQRGGLLRTTDLGNTWETLHVNGETHMTLVWVSEDGSTIVTGTAGLYHRTESMRGHSLYVSYDKGETFQTLPMPENRPVPGSRLSGLVAQRCEYDGVFLYITFAVTGRRSYVAEEGYSCDSGDALGGRVLRYAFAKNGRISGFTDITPCAGNTSPCAAPLPDSREALEYGFSGITSSRHGGGDTPGILACSTICKDDGDMILMSRDCGESWEVKLWDLSVGRMDFKTPYMLPACNGGHNLIHWLSDLKINPFRHDEVWFNTGTGVFVSRNFTDKTAVFQDCCDGIEETVHLNIYGMPAGEVQVVDILGDLGGFAFRSPDTPCDNSFADADGNRYITCINADFSDIHPETVIATPRGNWTGRTRGGIIISRDQCRSFTRLPMPYGLSGKIDRLLARIEKPNVNSGWVAMSPDCQNIVWSVADNSLLPVYAVLCSNDGGNHFAPASVQGATDSSCMKVFADRVNSSLMYGFGDASRIYISRDSGRHFALYKTPEGFPPVDFGSLSGAVKTEIRVESGKEGVLYIAMNTHGLYEMHYDAVSDRLSLTRLTKDGDAVYCFGLGILRPGAGYIAEDKAFYICGIIDGCYGFFRSLDHGKTWLRVNTDAQMFGDINSIDGDCRIFGRFYIATGSLGALYGDIA